MIKPIETVYNGYRFRSRLEARWAVFFDAVDVKYVYEPEGFLINGERYLPDFEILEGLDSVHYIEIKPTFWQPDAYRKCQALARESKKNVLMLFGIPGILDHDPEGLTEKAFTYKAKLLIGDPIGNADRGFYNWPARILHEFGPERHTLEALYNYGISRDCSIMSTDMPVNDCYYDLIDIRESRAANGELGMVELNAFYWKYAEMCSNQVQQAYRKAQQYRFEFGEGGGGQ